MTRNDTEELPGASAPVLSAAVLAQIHALNLDYIELLAAEHNVPELQGQLQHLPCKLHATIASLAPPARIALAALPYTLYSLGFEDEKLWRSLAEPAALASSLSMSERYAQPHSSSLQASLCEVALLYAWHVATSSPLAARLIYAMPEAVTQRLTAAPPWYVRRLAVHHASLLLPRWAKRCRHRRPNRKSHAVRCGRVGRRTLASGPTWCASRLREINRGLRQRRC